MELVRVAVIEADPAVLRELEELLNRDDRICVQGLASRIDEYLGSQEGLPNVDLLVIGVDATLVRDTNSWVLLRAFHKYDVRIVALIPRDSPEVLGRLLAMGVPAIITKDASEDEIVNTILRAASGEIAIQQVLLDKAIRNITEGSVGNKLRVGGLVMDLDSKEVSRWGMPIQLSTLEYRLLSYLALNRTRVVSVAELLEAVWHISFSRGGTEDQVYGCIKRLRRKVEPVARNPRYVRSLKGEGYFLDDPLEKEEA